MTPDDDLEGAAGELDELLAELRAMVAPAAWDRIEQVLQRVVTLYAGGLERALAHARAAGASPALDDLLCGDPLVASLLVLHGLHPHGFHRRVRDAVDAVVELLGDRAPAIELVEIRDDRSIALRVRGAAAGQAIGRALRRAIEEAAPEVTRIDIAGLEPAPDGLVQIRRHPEVRR